MALELGMPIKAAAVNKYLTDASYIKGGYCVVANATERDDLPVATATQDGIIVVGSLVYCVQEQEMYICTAISLVDNEPVATWTPFVSGSTVDPMVWMGTLGSSGATISSLPDTSSSNKGYVYKVVTDGTYTYNTSSSVTVKVGDTVISTGTEWVVIPSGDEPTYQSLSESSGSNEVSLCTRGEKYTWNHKQDTIAFNTAYNASTNKAATMSDIPSLSKGTTSGSGNAVTDVSVSGHTITLTKGSTFLTSISKGTTTGSGNAVTEVSVSGGTITLTKGSTFLTGAASSSNLGGIKIVTQASAPSTYAANTLYLITG